MTTPTPPEHPTPTVRTIDDLTLATTVGDYARWESPDQAEKEEFRDFYVDTIAALGGEADVTTDDPYAVEIQYTLSLRQYFAWPGEGYEITSLVSALAGDYPHLGIQYAGQHPAPERDAVFAKLQALAADAADAA